MKKKVAVLGVGEHQKSGIKQLRKKFIVYGFDGDKNAFSKSLVNKFYFIDIQDKEKIYKICRNNNIKKILSFNSEITLNSVLWINDKLENKKSLNKFLILNKIKLRKHLKKHNFPVPNFTSLDKDTYIRKSLFPAVVKPSSGSGSKGVFYSKDISQFKKFFNKNKLFYKNKKILIEKYIPGVEYAVEGWVDKDLKFKIGALSKKQRSKLPFLFDESLIINFKNIKLRNIIIKYIERLVKSLKLFNIPVHMEFKILKGKIYLIDFSFRGAGFTVYSEILSKIIEQNTDQIIIDMFFNKNFKINEPNENKYYLKFFYKKDLSNIKKYKKQIKNLKSFEKISYYKSLNRSAINEYSRFGHILLMSNNISLLKKN